MCTPSAISNSINVAANIFGQVNTISNVVNESNYRTQLAINNAESAKNEALRQKQLGINKARREKLLGIRQASTLAAKNAASGLDISSETNYYGYEDIIDTAYSNAQTIQDNYDLKADSYMEKANSYLDSARMNNKSTKNYLLNYALTGLGDAAAAASNWYKKREGGDVFDLF